MIFGWLSIWACVQEVVVEGTSITVRKGIFKSFSLDITEIDRVDWITSYTVYGKNENITVRAGKRKFKVESLFYSSSKMIAFLKDNVNEDIIHTRTVDFRGKS